MIRTVVVGVAAGLAWIFGAILIAACVLAATDFAREDLADCFLEAWPFGFLFGPAVGVASLLWRRHTRPAAGLGQPPTRT
jgi:hypothetical protein